MRSRKSAIALASLLLLSNLAWGLPALASPAVNYLVNFREQPNAAATSKLADESDRRQALYQIAIDTASRTQSGVRALLAAEQAAGRVERSGCLYLVNACSFRGQTSVADAIAARPEVLQVTTDEIVTAPTQPPTDGAVSWDNVGKIGAREAWNLGFSGKGVVIGSIDTGADLGHPAIRTKYRGYVGGGLDHDYNWFDAVSGKQQPYDEPNSHGTHTLGTTVGGDGPAPDVAGGVPDIGVAYGAKWMAAKAFDGSGSSLTSTVLLAMQWMAFPLSSRGYPDPSHSKTPDIVLNSWSVPNSEVPAGCRAWFATALKMWRHLDILPVFSSGDGGGEPSSPGDLHDALAVGATNQSDARTGFSNHGNSACTVPARSKPDVHAPGVDIDSSLNQGGYGLKSGTSMAAPHVAGTAALMIEAAGGSNHAMDHLVDFRVTSTADSCINGRNDLPCRRVNAGQAVRASQVNSIIRGTVRDAAGRVQEGAKVLILADGAKQAATLRTDRYGVYQHGVTAGLKYHVTVQAFGSIRETQSVTMPSTPSTQILDFNLDQAPLVTLSGVVTTDTGQPAAAAEVKLLDTPLPVINTDANGGYAFSGDNAVPDPSDPIGHPDPPGVTYNDYDITFKGSNCTEPELRQINIDANPKTVNVKLTTKWDRTLAANSTLKIHSCEEAPLGWKGGSTALGLVGNDVSAEVDLPFAFPFYSTSQAGSESNAYRKAYISDNGWIRFDGGGPYYFNTSSPDGVFPNAAIYAFWDDLRMDIRSKVLISTGADSFTVEWRDMVFAYPYNGLDPLTGEAINRITFSATLYPNGDIEFRYLSLSGPRSSGIGATIGLENEDGNIGFTYSHNEAVVRAGLGIIFTVGDKPASLTGTVEDPTGAPAPGASVSATRTGVSRNTVTNTSGQYFLRLQEGRYDLRASLKPYGDDTDSVDLFGGQTSVVNFDLLPAPRYEVFGTVRDSVSGTALAEAPVLLEGEGISTSTSSDGWGSYRFGELFEGQYHVVPNGSGRCRPNGEGVTVTVAADTQVDLSMSRITDGFGYRCEDFAGASWLPGVTETTLSGDTGSATASLPFAFPFYGQWATQTAISIDGLLTFGSQPTTATNGSIPSVSSPNNAVYAFWDDLEIKADPNFDSKVYTRHVSSPNMFVVEWRDVLIKGTTDRVTFEVVLYPNGDIAIQYLTHYPHKQTFGSGATVGIENATGSEGFKYSTDEAALKPGLRIHFINPAMPSTPPPGGDGGGGTPAPSGITGIVFDAKTGVGLASTDLTLTNGTVSTSTTTGPTGRYTIDAAAGIYRLSAFKSGYHSVIDAIVEVSADGYTTYNLPMTARGIGSWSGYVRDSVENCAVLPGAPAIGCPVGEFPLLITGPSGSLQTDSDRTGFFEFKGLVEGIYTVEIVGNGLCQKPATFNVTVLGNIQQDVNVELRKDPFGYACVQRTKLMPYNGAVPLPVTNDRPTLTLLPFDLTIYGTTSKLISVSAQGTITLMKSPLEPGPVIKVFEDSGIRVDIQSSVSIYVASVDAFVIQWSDVVVSGERLTFEAILFRNNEVKMYYLTGATPVTSGANAVIGIFDSCGNNSFVYSNNQTGAVSRNLEVTYAKRFVSQTYTAC